MDQSRLTELSDEQLQNLHANALRLAQFGTVKQRGDAEALLPAVGNEVERRQAERAEAAEAKRQAVRARRPRKLSAKALAKAASAAAAESQTEKTSREEDESET